MIPVRYQMAAVTLLLVSGAVSGQDDRSRYSGRQPTVADLNGYPSDARSYVGDDDVQWRPAAEADRLDPTDGADLYTQIDETAQYVIESEGAALPTECQCGTKHCHGVCRDPGRPAKPRWTKPGDVDRGDCPPLRYRMDDCKRAGNPHRVACWAKCSVNEKYSSWFVGGGAPWFRGRCRKPSEGTWGLDYGGMFGHANVWLNYTRGRNQGGEGAYATDSEPAIISKAHHLLHFGH